MCTLFLKIAKFSYSQSDNQRNLSLEIKYSLELSTVPLLYLTLLQLLFLTMFFFVSTLFLFPRLYQININRLHVHGGQLGNRMVYLATMLNLFHLTQ